MLDELINIRRELHQIPEEGYREFKTRDYICKKLDEYGIGYEIILSTAVIAFIDVKALSSVAFRADMDGLCVNECTNTDFQSTHPGYMHACGHDGHMASCLVAAKVMNENKASLKENIVFIFQPAEEGPGGAKQIIEQGILKKYNVKRIYGTHLYPSLKEGLIAVNSGYFMAQTGEFYITITGKSSHAAKPQDGIDSLLAACKLVTSVDEIKKQLQKEGENTVISIGTIAGGERVNVIAECTTLSGTMRTYDTALRTRIKNMINDRAEQIDSQIGTKTTIEYIDLYPAVYNDDALYKDFIKKVPDAVAIEPSMLAEDFAFYLQEVPGIFFFTGIYNEEKGYIYPLHSNKFNFDEKALLKTVDVYLKMAGLDTQL
jgi:amidohydrolase